MPQSLRKSEPDQNSPGPFKIDLAECRRYAIAKMAKDKGVEPNDDASDKKLETKGDISIEPGAVDLKGCDLPQNTSGDKEHLSKDF